MSIGFLHIFQGFILAKVLFAAAQKHQTGPPRVYPQSGPANFFSSAQRC